MSRERASFLRDWPTMADSGLNVDAGLNLGLYVPAGTPGSIVSRLDAEMQRSIDDYVEPWQTEATRPATANQFAAPIAMGR